MPKNEAVIKQNLSVPKGLLGFLNWGVKHPFSSLISLAFLGFLLVAAWSFIEWAFIKAVWVGSSRADSQPGGATWAFIGDKLILFIFGFYHPDHYWRIVLCLVLLAAYIVPFFIKPFKQKALWFVVILVLSPLTVSILIAGGFGLPQRSTNDLGGLSLTVILAYLGLLLSFPLGVFLALGRQSKLPVIRRVSIGYIEFFRGIPLISILFMSSVAVPFFLPPGVTIDKLFRVTLGLVLFQSAYLAEVIRGGLQAVSKGQYEAADSLGLGYGLKNYLIILPQALKLTIANIGGISISCIKDTTLVLIIGMFDLLGIVNPLSSDTKWLGLEPEGLLFAGLVYWLICFAVSRVTFSMEKKFNTLPTVSATPVIPDDDPPLGSDATDKTSKDSKQGDKNGTV